MSMSMPMAVLGWGRGSQPIVQFAASSPTFVGTYELLRPVS